MLGVDKEIFKVSVYRCPHNGTIVEEEWKNHNGLLHRWDDAAIIKRDRNTGFDTHRSFWLNGNRHRPEGKPALLEFDEDTGELFRRSWFEHGEYVRHNDLPHVEWLDPQTRIVVRAEYRIINNSKQGSALHRVNGPALINFDPATGEETEAVFYRFGRKQKPPIVSGPHP